MGRGMFLIIFKDNAQTCENDSHPGIFYRNERIDKGILFQLNGGQEINLTCISTLKIELSLQFKEK